MQRRARRTPCAGRIRGEAELATLSIPEPARREYTAYEEVAADYGSGALHPGDLKPALARALNAILQPVRDHFAGDERARKLLAQARPCARRRVRVASQCSLSWRQRAWQLLCAPGSVCRVSLGAALLGHLHRSCHACTIGLIPNRVCAGFPPYPHELRVHRLFEECKAVP